MRMMMSSSITIAMAIAIGCTVVSNTVALPPVPPIEDSPSCMLNGKPCPLPDWDVDWSLINSTALMNANVSGFHPTHRWGFVTLDWQCDFNNWIKPNAEDIDVEAHSASICRELKTKGLVKRCSIYHNMELALEWLKSERAVMDQAHIDAGWFLRFANGSVVNEARYVRAGVGPLLNQYFIDWRNSDATTYFVSAIVNATRQTGVDSTFTDDSTGVPDEHPEIIGMLNLTKAEEDHIQFASQAGGQRLAVALAKADKTCWNCIDGVEGPTGGRWGMNTRRPPVNAAECIAYMRSKCTPEMQARGLFMEWDTGWNESATTKLYHEQTVAAFLIVRPRFAFIGTSYGLTDADWSPLFALDVGEPLGLCEETKQGVFARKWTKGAVSLDCNTYTPGLPFASLAQTLYPMDL
eukprot:m.15951 g.15951  ORF g.15951 m.15951 type:complete len:408 (+) comp10795_c0_seq2:211-1434(+)